MDRLGQRYMTLLHATGPPSDPSKLRLAAVPPRGVGLASRLCCVAKQTITTIVLVEPSNDGWSVRVRGECLGSFSTHRQALDDVKRRRARLTAKGQRSTVLVTRHGVGLNQWPKHTLGEGEIPSLYRAPARPVPLQQRRPFFAPSRADYWLARARGQHQS